MRLRRDPVHRPPVPAPGRAGHAVRGDVRLRLPRGPLGDGAGAGLDGAGAPAHRRPGAATFGSGWLERRGVPAPEPGLVGRAGPHPRRGRLLRPRRLRRRPRHPPAVRAGAGRRRRRAGPRAPAVPHGHGHPVVGPPRRPGHGPGLLGARRSRWPGTWPSASGSRPASRWPTSTTPSRCSAQTYDIAYQSLGSLNWHPDMARWAEILLRAAPPGRSLLLLEGHPLAWVLDDDGEKVDYPYFADPAGHRISRRRRDLRRHVARSPPTTTRSSSATR